MNQVQPLNFIIANPYWFVAICTYIALTVNTVKQNNSYPSVWNDLNNGFMNFLLSLFWPYYFLSVLLIHLIAK